jgi:hypothetical protein
VIVAATAVLVMALVLVAWSLERRERLTDGARRDELHQQQLVALMAANAAEREAWAKERADLLQRIQAPEQAVIDHATAIVPEVLRMPPVLSMDDDDEHQVSKDELADREWAAEVA